MKSYKETIESEKISVEIERNNVRDEHGNKCTTFSAERTDQRGNYIYFEDAQELVEFADILEEYISTHQLRAKG